MRWDPEVESPATIAVIGAGPVGIEAALYARFLGYIVDIFDAARPAAQVTRWHQRKLGVAVGDCTTPLGFAAIESQDPAYQRPAVDDEFTGQRFADEYLIPLAKSDLLADGIHIHSRVVEVSRLRTSLENDSDLQQRCNDEFRLLIQARDRGYYTSRADLVIDCRNAMGSECGWGPAGSHAIGSDEVRPFVHRWHPDDPRFELRDVQGKQTILFGQSEAAKRFAVEWVQLVQNHDAPHLQAQLRRLAALDAPIELDLKLIWLIPMISTARDAICLALAEELAGTLSQPKAFSFCPIRGIERIARTESGRWNVEMLQGDDGIVELSGDVFAAYPNPRPTQPLGRELLSQEFLVVQPTLSTGESLMPNGYSDWPGWRVATHEPHYYRLGSMNNPHHPQGLKNAHSQIRDLFALLGARADLDLYGVVASP